MAFTAAGRHSRYSSTLRQLKSVSNWTCDFIPQHIYFLPMIAVKLGSWPLVSLTVWCGRTALVCWMSTTTTNLCGVSQTPKPKQVAYVTKGSSTMRPRAHALMLSICMRNIIATPILNWIHFDYMHGYCLSIYYSDGCIYEIINFSVKKYVPQKTAPELYKKNV